MKADAVSFCIGLGRAQASLNLKLDDELGTLHGLGLRDFTLLYALSQAEGGRLPASDLVQPMGVRLSAVTRQLILLEKTGLVQREVAEESAGRRYVRLRPAAKRLLGEAVEIAEAVCASALAALPPETVVLVQAALARIAQAPALKL